LPEANGQDNPPVRPVPSTSGLSSQAESRLACVHVSGRSRDGGIGLRGEVIMTADWESPASSGAGARYAALVSCWMCGISLHPTQMVPDGGDACEDIRWYCRDAQGCTERRFEARRQQPAASS
jgi:hypothetical protein